MHSTTRRLRRLYRVFNELVTPDTTDTEAGLYAGTPDGAGVTRLGWKGRPRKTTTAHERCGYTAEAGGVRGRIPTALMPRRWRFWPATSGRRSTWLGRCFRYDARMRRVAKRRCTVGQLLGPCDLAEATFFGRLDDTRALQGAMADYSAETGWHDIACINLDCCWVSSRWIWAKDFLSTAAVRGVCTTQR